MTTQTGEELFIGIDVGTGGVRAAAVAATGELVAQGRCDLPASPPCEVEGGHEQDPGSWWQCLCRAATELTGKLGELGIDPARLRGLAVDGTSGTLVCVDATGLPTRPALMYNDARSGVQAEQLNELAGDSTRQLGYRFEPSYALAKILWVRDCDPDAFARTARCIHQADYVQSRLVGKQLASDYSNALKTGYDLIGECWPAWMERLDGVVERLPDIVAPGTRVGEVGAEGARATGLPKGLPVVAGATDGTAGCLASGLRRPGEYNTTLGTTLTFKGLSDHPCRHPQGLVYSHKLPGDRWLPGAASNTGGEWMSTLFAEADLPAMDAAAESLFPLAIATYPLVRTGERFPFKAPQAVGFCAPVPSTDTEQYAAYLQGTALVERLAYEVLDQVAGTSGGDVYSTGGGSRSDVWMQCRATVTGRITHRPECPESAFGSAVLAAAGTAIGDLWRAVRAMVRIETAFDPDPTQARQYEDLYGQFCAALRERGYTSQ